MQRSKKARKQQDSCESDEKVRKIIERASVEELREILAMDMGPNRALWAKFIVQVVRKLPLEVLSAEELSHVIFVSMAVNAITTPGFEKLSARDQENWFDRDAEDMFNRAMAEIKERMMREGKTTLVLEGQNGEVDKFTLNMPKVANC